MRYDNETKESYEVELVGWIMDKAEKWRNHYDSNYSEKFDEYYRIWRGIWSAEDKMRESERSKLISPATQQAVESAVAEVEEATFGRGKWFDIRDNMGDNEAEDVQYLRNKLYEDFQYTKVRRAVAEVILNSAVFGTGMAEIVMEEVQEMKPATQPILEGALQAVGVNIQPRTVVKVRPVLPQNFLIDPVATNIEDAVGVIIDEFVPIHQVHKAQLDGVYLDEYVGSASTDTEIEPDKEENTSYDDDKVRLTKYYGLVPKNLFEAAMKYAAKEEDEYEEDEKKAEKDLEEAAEGSSKDSDEPVEYVEAIVVIGNKGCLLKVQENPYMMQDRPVIAFAWDVVPGRFWGRGICEKAYNSQKALDAELRARIDALALTVHPMMAMDATRMPRGSKFEIKPGKSILTNGNPQEILFPFKFGSLDQVTFAQAGELQKMVQMATGAVDAAGIPGSINGEAAAGAVSMSLGAIIKRHKRTLINFQESFLIPLIEKSAWRYMQFDPDNYPVKDYKFVASSSLGVIAREYEVTQLVQLMQTLGPEDPIRPMLLTAVVDNMSLSNREELINQLKAAAQPNPEAQQAQQAQMQMQMRGAEAEIAKTEAEAQKAQAEAQKALVQAQLEPEVVRAKLVSALSNNLNEDNEGADFERRAKIAELMLKERDLDIKIKAIESDERITREQMQFKAKEDSDFKAALE
jgi:hypothetical protein